MNRLIATAAAICLSTGTANAASVLTQVVTYNGVADVNNVNGITSNAGALPFFYFDTTVGTLNSIEFSSSYGINSTIVASGGSQASSGSVRTESAARFSSDNAAVTNALNLAVNLRPSAVVGGTTLAPVAYDLFGSTSTYSLAPGASSLYFSNASGNVGTLTVTDATTLAAFSRVGTASYNVLLSTLTGVAASQSGGNATFTNQTLFNGQLTIVYNITPFATQTPSASAVPEPATWAMMLAGFGLVGGSLRRRRRDMVVAG